MESREKKIGDFKKIIRYIEKIKINLTNKIFQLKKNKIIINF